MSWWTTSSTVSLPRYHFPLVPAPEYLFLAGGIGITAVLPMLRAAAASQVPASLVYVGQSAATMPFTDELRAAYGRRVRTVATREQGRPDFGALAAGLNPATLVYCCGPEPMLTAAGAAFPPDRLHTERFHPVAKPFAASAEFEVLCAKSGRTVQVPADETLLDALTHAGHPLPSGCREGVCGSCELTVLEGEPEHRDDIGAPAGRMYACVSRALGRGWCWTSETADRSPGPKRSLPRTEEIGGTAGGARAAARPALARLLGQVTAVDDMVAARHIRGVVGHQERDECGNLGRLRGTPQGDGCEETVGGAGRQRGDHRGVDDAR